MERRTLPVVPPAAQARVATRTMLGKLERRVDGRGLPEHEGPASTSTSRVLGDLWRMMASASGSSMCFWIVRRSCRAP